MFTIAITYPWHRHSSSPAYNPKWFEAETPEEAAILFQEHVGTSRRLDLSLAVERLSDGKELSFQDAETGRTVSCKQLEGVMV